MADLGAVVTIVAFAIIAVYFLRSIKGPSSPMTNFRINWRADDDDQPTSKTAEPVARKPYRASYGAARARNTKRQDET